MNRRQLFKSLGALAIAAAVPASFARDWSRAKLIEGEVFVLHEPFVIRAGWPITIRGCAFLAADDFVGDCLLRLEAGASGALIHRCSFEMKAMAARMPPLALDKFAAIRILGDQPPLSITGITFTAL